MAFYRVGLIAFLDFSCQVERSFCTDISKNHKTEQHKIVGINSVLAPVTKIGNGSMSSCEPDDTGETDQEAGEHCKADQNVDDILDRTKALN